MTYAQKISTIVLLTVTLTASVFFAPRVNAQIITEQKVEQQRQTVHAQLLVTLEEHVKLLQMILIRHLEVQLAQLQAQQSQNTK